MRRPLPLLRPAVTGLARIEPLRAGLTAGDLREAYVDGARLTMDQAVAVVAKGRGRRKRPTTGWASLTPSELEVVKLVADGMTNPEVGERLFVSRRTVQTHVASVLRKIGARNRAELASLYRQHAD